jgi:hypothetical protein
MGAVAKRKSYRLATTCLQQFFPPVEPDFYPYSQAPLICALAEALQRVIPFPTYCVRKIRFCQVKQSLAAFVHFASPVWLLSKYSPTP